MKNFLARFVQKRTLYRSRIQNRKKEYVHIRECNSVLFAFDVSTAGADSMIKEFIRFFQKYGIKYTGIAVDLKADEAAASVYASRPDFLIMSKKEVNWLDIPRAEFLSRIRQSDYDIFIDFDMGERCFPCDFLLNISEARMIVGFDKNADRQYDICFPNRKGKNDPTFSEQVIEYLNTIH